MKYMRLLTFAVVVLLFTLVGHAAYAQEFYEQSGPDPCAGTMDPDECMWSDMTGGSAKVIACTAKGSVGGYCVNCQARINSSVKECVKAEFSAYCKCEETSTTPCKPTGTCTYYK